MPAALDQLADKNGAELVRLSKLYEFPPFVKSANLELTMTPPQTAPYADPRPAHRQFPCHNKAATWISCLYFQEKKAEFHPKDQKQILRTLDHYAGFWAIKEAVDRMRGRWEELNKAAEAKLPDSAYAWIWANDDGTKDRRLPIRSAMEVKVAADWLKEHRDQIPYQHRNRIAVRILEKTASFGVGLGELTEFIEKQAGRGVCEPDEVVGMIRGRALLTNNAAYREKIASLAEAVSSSPRQALSPDRLVKLAETVDGIDRAIGIVGKYGQTLQRPEDVIFKATFTKAAAELDEHVATSSGRVYEKQAFKKLAVEDVKSLFGDDFAKRVTTGLSVDPEKMAEEVATLPRPDAVLLDGLLSDHGIAPALTKAASVKQGFTPQDWTKMAESYLPAR